MSEAFDWLEPSPLWRADGQSFRNASFFRPRIFESRSDDFMDEFLSAASGNRLSDLKTPTATGSQPVKLYQPIHGRFYVVSATLACRFSGFPDRQVNKSDGESVFFVLRRLASGGEQAWISSQPNWKSISNPQALLEGEERLTLSSATTDGDRSIFVGYIPVASRETYAVPAAELSGGSDPTDFRVEEFNGRFVFQITPPGESVIDVITDPEIALNVSVYVLLDFFEFLHDQGLEDVADNLVTATSFSGEKAIEKNQLRTKLSDLNLGGPGGISLAQALHDIGQKREQLNQEGGANLSELGLGQQYNLQNHGMAVGGLVTRLKNALPDEQPPPVEIPKIQPQANTQYVLRCVYERPQCKEVVQVVSRPTEPFRLAPFFDVDAPSRPVRIPLPTDISLSALRKFKKGVSFMVPPALHRRTEAISGIESEIITGDKEPAADSGDGLAFICSFSIQIIFIVAFMLLLIFVIILNIAFYWIAFFKICLPVPKSVVGGT